MPLATAVDVFLTMREDVRRALNKPRAKRKWAMVIDLRKCIGCHACTMACKSENISPPGVMYRRVIETESGKYPEVKRHFVPVLCNQCENPPCVPPCPVTATTKRDDGIVDIKYKQCIGCRACLNACPYGARQSDFGEFYTVHTPQLEKYETRPAFEYNQSWPRKKRKSPIGNARKCHFCINRIETGLLPACINTCVARALYFGDQLDPESKISELIANNKVKVLKENLGTKPKVYYIGLEGVEI